MGHGTSTHARERVRRSLSTRRRGEVAQWRFREQLPPLFAVVRHCERADDVAGLYEGGRWTQTEDFLEWPLDPPLSDGGFESARTVGEKCQMLANDHGSRFHVVVTSPYCRCVQTAVEICATMGNDVRLLIDYSLGEVYGPSVLGQVEPTGLLRPASKLAAYLESRGVSRRKVPVVGETPRWPESLKAARTRYASRFLKYLNRSVKARKNFLLVTHADGVGAALAVMPSQQEQNILSVDSGGFFAGVKHKPRGTSTWATGGYASMGRGMIRVAWSALKTPSEGGAGGEETCDNVHGEEALPPTSQDGWQIHTSGIGLQRRTGQRGALARRINALSQFSDLPQTRIELLLGTMNNAPLDGTSIGDDGEFDRLPTLLSSTDSLMQGPVMVSLSTYAFGASDLDLSGNLGCLQEVTEYSCSSRTSSLTPKTKGHMRVVPTASSSPLRRKPSASSPLRRKPSARAAASAEIMNRGHSATALGGIQNSAMLQRRKRLSKN
eukprot:TRINITY_DN32867_c0_g1_i2.p1 TRINITY_DN32867_c0_g1~~TRINITY_DN32867_c0_g1_i2.p1  ORF type:complete len:495 (+),score=82.62 TRINITY_DN32867_c0_g1_i2:56-1540(+)